LLTVQLEYLSHPSVEEKHEEHKTNFKGTDLHNGLAGSAQIWDKKCTTLK